MYDDDELIGVEDVSVFELELIQKRRLAHRSQAGHQSVSAAESDFKFARIHELETGIILDSPVITESHISSATDQPTTCSTDAEPDSARNPDYDLDTGLTADAEPIDEDTYTTDAFSASKRPCRYTILSERLMDERRYDDLMKSVNDLQYREQLYEEYAIGPTDTT